ncbi:hypothetical protein [Luteipulveratus mongoliensis]|uniref:Uncharacterized protein n=1 Tax=Luteipulveratus mongoliensis TaxID=571913 RepID=A0A0K1JF15_9MICO|nr:hypothetical protein [Luteipulveratus mongoliensis]AKU15294.1 hypothetical protein VV02_04505 [Luteipulveratus mongoliensis]
MSTTSLPSVISGVVPHLGVKADHVPRSETGIGALMPWADRLWMVTYVAHTSNTGGGTGLFTIDDDLVMTKHPESVVGTYANRLVHAETDQLFIGPHAIDAKGEVTTIPALAKHRLTATARHLTDPANKVYVLGMEGEFFELDVHTYEVTQLFDLLEVLDINDAPHFKDMYTRHGRVVVANNAYYPKDFERGFSDGRLAEWDGTTWRVLSKTQWNTLSSANGMSEAMYAVGQDRASALFHVYLPETGWKVYRLPKSTHTQDHAWTTEWPRIREVESERLLMDASGMFYELPSLAYGNAVWGIRPIASHLRIVGDFCSWNGLLVLAGDQNTPIHDANPVAGQPQAGLWFGKTDDLWSWGKPQGWGGPWWETDVEADVPSDPFLMTGFEHKCLHLSHDADTDVAVHIEVDFKGTGEFRRYQTVTVGAKGYEAFIFPAGFSAHWVRLVPSVSCQATGQLVYT